MKYSLSLLVGELASKPNKPRKPKTKKLTNANDNLVIPVIREKSTPEISSLYFCSCISVISAWIEGGMTKSAPRQNPVRQEIIVKKSKSPGLRNNTKIKKVEEDINETDQALALFVFLLNCVQNGTPIIENKK